jgi:hypothetical protein
MNYSEYRKGTYYSHDPIETNAEPDNGADAAWNRLVGLYLPLLRT